MTAVGRAVRREVGLFVVGGSVLEGSWSLHKVELCVSSWREVGPFIKVEICLKNFDVASSLVGDFSLIIHWKRSWSLSRYYFWLLISEEKLVSFLLFGKFCSLFVCGWSRGSFVSSSWMRFLLPPNNLWLIVLRRSHRVSHEWFSAMMLDGCHLMKLVRFVHMISLKITFLAIQLSWLLSSPALAAFEELLLTTKMSLFALKLFLPVIMRLTHLALPWKSWANLALTVNISRLSTFLSTFPKMFFEKYGTVAYRLIFQSSFIRETKLFWTKPSDPLDEILFPKHVLDHEGITDILHDNQGSLKCYSQSRNGCFDIEGGQNYKSLSFRPGSRSHDYRQKLHALVQLARRITKEGTTGSVQTKYWTNWKNGKGDVKIEKSLLFCRHLDHLKLGKFANFLTRCDINFYCAARSTIVIDVEGIDASVLIRLMHYAELPIPTTEAQGAFSLNIRSVGICASDPTLLAFCVSFGRIGSLPSYPVQIKSKELKNLLTSPIKESAIVIWLQQKISGFNFQIVTCVDEEQHVDEYLQFRISTAIPGSFPNHYTVNGVNFRIDHALPYAMPISSGVRPPTAQSVHDHWKSSVKRTSNDRKGHANAVEKVENCSGSMLRCLRLREVVAQDDHGKYSACFEKGHVPLCFFRKEVPVDVALEYFTYWCRSFSAMEDHMLCALDELCTSSKNIYSSDDCQRLCIATVRCLSEQSLKVGLFFKGKYGWTVSTSERLQCYAYTACTIILVLPGGYRIEDICSPADHISVQKIFSLDDKQLGKSDDDKQGVSSGPVTATPLGSNPLHLQGSTQASDVAKSQKSGASKVIGTEGEMSPTLPWPKHDLQSCQAYDQQSGHLSDRIYRPPETETDDTKPVTADCRPRSNGRGLDETAKGIKGLSPDNQPDSKSSQLGVIKPHVEGQASSAPNVDQGGQPSPAQLDNRSVLYAGEKLMPKLVTAESCVGEGIPDPRSNDNLEGQVCHPDMQIAAQNVLPPGAVSRSPPPRERKSRSVSVNKRGCTNKTRPASFARSVSPTISKIQAGQTKDQMKSLLQTTPHKQKSNITRNKNRGLLPQVDVSKPVATPVPPDVDMSPCKPKDHQVDADIVDLVKKLSKEEKEQETLMKTEINDAVHKWCATYPAAHQIRVAHVAFKFRCRISSTICFLVAAYRLLAKAPWTTNMIAVDIKQAAFYAISKGWSLKDPTAGDFPFSVAELAVAAATYLEQIPPGVPEDPFYALFVMLGFLPPVCSKLFSTVTLTCSHCLATCTAPCPFFNTHVTWAMTDWVDFATALAEATMHPWVQSQGWHAEGCNMSQHLIDLKTMTSWVLLQLQPEHHDKYPFVCDSMNLAKDQSLLRINATITGFLCSNSRSQQDRRRHYWVVEFENGIPKYVFDSLQGKQRLTTELAKKLRVFGVLFNVGNEHVPFLRTRYLDEAAGIVPAIHRGRNPIIVLGRGRIQWARNALCKKYKAPTSKKGRVQKHMLKGSKQNRPRGNPSGARSAKGPTAEKKNGGSHKPTKSGRRQTNSTRKTLPWLFSQASGAPPSPRHHADDISQILEISDDSESENHLEAEPGELRNDLPLSDPISEFPSSRETSGVGDGRAANGSPAEDKRVPTVPRERSRSPLSSRGKPPRQAPFSQCADNEKKEFTLAAREVGPAANTENAVGIAEWEVGPTGDNKGIGSSAREVGPAANSGETVGSAKQIFGPIASPGDACPGSDGAIQHGCQLKTKPGKYGIISLFDGVSSVVRVLTKKLGCPPTAILLAENDESIRRLVCTEFGYRTDEKWGYTMSGSACLYISDVHKLAENDCLLLRQLAAQFPGLKWFIIGGVPMSGPHLCWIPTWSIGVSWCAKSSFLPPPSDHTHYPDFGWHFFRTFPCWKCWFYEGRTFCCLSANFWGCHLLNHLTNIRGTWLSSPASSRGNVTFSATWLILNLSRILTHGILKTVDRFWPFVEKRLPLRLYFAQENNELWNLSFVLDIVSAACVSLGLLLLGWQGGLSALLQHSDWAQTCSRMGTPCSPTLSWWLEDLHWSVTARWLHINKFWQDYSSVAAYVWMLYLQASLSYPDSQRSPKTQWTWESLDYDWFWGCKQTPWPSHPWYVWELFSSGIDTLCLW